MRVAATLVRTLLMVLMVYVVWRTCLELAHRVQVEATYAREAVALVDMRRSSRFTAKQDSARVQDFLLGKGATYEGLTPFDSALASWWLFKNPPASWSAK